MSDFLTKLIDDSSTALECPVCFETSQKPIYQCIEGHLICSICRLKVASCPVCKVPYNGLHMRNRTAEENARKLDQMIQQTEEILSEDNTSQGQDVVDGSAETENVIEEPEQIGPEKSKSGQGLVGIAQPTIKRPRETPGPDSSPDGMRAGPSGIQKRPRTSSPTDGLMKDGASPYAHALRLKPVKVTLKNLRLEDLGRKKAEEDLAKKAEEDDEKKRFED